MDDSPKAFLTTLYESYNESSVIKGLIQALSVYGLPIGSMVDSSIGAYVNKIKDKRLRTFFDELNRGDVTLTEEQIKSNDFLNAYFETVSYVLRTKSDEKINRFAKILKKVYSGILTIEDFDDYAKIFDDLTDKEFAILSILYKYEQKNVIASEPLARLESYKLYWDDFKAEVINSTHIKENELNSFLVRLQRTGCFLRFNSDGILLDGPDPDEKGNTSELFKTIMEIIEY